ncbi:hypothetical protein NDU88_002630 [Pleurodeles waltl]|uniref:Uncharacterized protein n=1 Tax=Pleurodeles waltl TaxID=8319 RepID=A0AAV7W160_PLEWA|nr:hypothetical protein NDU88_002630 [Pleurodeles waltl]
MSDVMHISPSLCSPSDLVMSLRAQSCPGSKGGPQWVQASHLIPLLSSEAGDGPAGRVGRPGLLRMQVFPTAAEASPPSVPACRCGHFSSLGSRRRPRPGLTARPPHDAIRRAGPLAADPSLQKTGRKELRPQLAAWDRPQDSRRPPARPAVPPECASAPGPGVRPAPPDVVPARGLPEQTTQGSTGPPFTRLARRPPSVHSLFALS